MVRKNSQAKDNEVERLIKKCIREMKRETNIKDKFLLRAKEENIRNRIEFKNSIEGVSHYLKYYGGDTDEDEKRRHIIAKTLLKLPYKVRNKMIDEVAFLNADLSAGKVIWIKPLVVEWKVKAVILLNPIPSKSERGRMNTIAHEIAHFTLEHHKIQNRKKLPELNIREKKADDLAEKWGFKRVYKDYISM
ncbi:MAG: hypothetical protein V3U54_04875 [Thermodesulfobacteriota bacterium]